MIFKKPLSLATMLASLVVGVPVIAQESEPKADWRKIDCSNGFLQ